MIFYFSGTGNSQWAAQQLADRTDDEAVSIVGLKPESVKIETGSRLGIVFPIYAWSYPKILGDFVKSLDIPKGVYIYAVCTCGSECGHAMKKLAKLLPAPLSAQLSLPMPNNYVLGTPVDTPAEEQRKITAADERIERFAAAVNAGKDMTLLDVGTIPVLKSGIVAWGFNTFAMSDKPFTVSDACIGCGLCEKNCPTGNIKLTDKKPLWNGDCTLCLSCLNRCPKEAIEYGKQTVGMGRYYFGKNS